MANVNSVLLHILFICFISCKGNHQLGNREHLYDSKITIVNDDVDSAFYKKSVYVRDGNYYADSSGNLTFLITKGIVSFGKDFGKNISDALKYYYEHTTDPDIDTDGIYLVYTISILKVDRTFEPI